MSDSSEMNQEEFAIMPSAIDHNVFFVYRSNGSEIKIIVSTTNQNAKTYITVRNKFLISSVALTSNEVNYFKTHFQTH
ncbi:hypothetical protein AWE51_00085 [Aquimarina aggregata]|uniref:Uncharacterized protein n=1 Tax=Aquimarina aggregata TaxID=1642818 RepID=A0A162CVY7_9FLAO|nr:hypothetical protein AWE51_00085 [Aquimarina aggregata]